MTGYVDGGINIDHIDGIERQLLERVRAYREEMVPFCSRLLQIPSVNGVHDEIGVAEAIAERAEQLGLHVQMVADEPQRPNVIISTAADGDTGLLLLGHLDTVPPGDESAWTHPPFSGAVVDGRIYGRGAIDTKGGMTAALYALTALAQMDSALHDGRAQFIGVPDEESGATGTLGIKVLAREGLLSARGAIYAYSGNEIALGHRGLIRYRLTCRGQAEHTGTLSWQNRTSGANAVTGMARLLLALEQLAFPMSSHRYFDEYKPIVTPGTMISGGTSINIVPDYCEALVDIRLTPEYDLTRFETLMVNVIARVTAESVGVRFEYELLNYVPAAISDENAPLFRITEDVVEAVTGQRPPRVVAGPANEGYLLIEHGIPTICGLGPVGRNAHAVDEYVTVDGLVEAASIFAIVGRRLSATSPPDPLFTP